MTPDEIHDLIVEGCARVIERKSGNSADVAAEDAAAIRKLKRARQHNTDTRDG